MEKELHVIRELMKLLKPRDSRNTCLSSVVELMAMYLEMTWVVFGHSPGKKLTEFRYLCVPFYSKLDDVCSFSVRKAYNYRCLSGEVLSAEG